MRSCLFVSFALLTISITSGYDYFGKNKVQYEKLRFRRLETPRFYVYYPEGSEELALYAQLVCEDHACTLEKKLSLTKKDKTPIIIYSSLHQFLQTNVILELLEEGVGGFFELLKRRVVVPYEGSLDQFARVLRHEVTHIYEYELFFKGKLPLFKRPPIPFFILEGFSEYSASKAVGREAFSEIYLRDYVTNNVLEPSHLLASRGLLAYRLGEAFFFYIDKKYGEEKVYELLLTLRKKNFSCAIQSLFGKTVSSFACGFFEYLKGEAFPLYARKKNDTLLTFLTSFPKRGVYNTTPQISPKGDKVIFLSNRRGRFEVYITDTYSGKFLRKVKGLKAPKEEVRFLRRAVTIAAPQGGEELIAMFVTREARKELRILGGDLRLKRRFSFPLDDCFDPAFSPDGKALAFAGQKDGFLDLFLISLESGELARLTSDFYPDFSPSFSPDGETLFFVSGRSSEGSSLKRGVSIWAYSLKDKTMRKLSGDLLEASSPHRLPTGGLLFLGEGSQVFCQDTCGRLFKTNFFSGFEYLSLSRDGKVCLAYFKNSSWEIAVCELSKLRQVMEEVTPPTAERDTIRLEEEIKGEPLGFSLSADYARGEVSWRPGALSGHVEVALSDVLGDHRFLILTDLTGIVDFSNFYLSYWYLRERVDYNWTLYQFVYGYKLRNRLYLYQDRGLFSGIVYPFSKEERVETGLGFKTRKIEEYRLVSDRWRLSQTTSFFEVPYFCAYVFDNTKWTLFGPASGTRARWQGQVSFWKRSYYTSYIDFRHYLSLYKDYILASRIFGIGSLGRERDTFYLDGRVVQGYEYYEFIDTTGPFLSAFALEFRFPFIKEMRLGFPPLEIGNISGRLFLEGGFLLKGACEWDKRDSWFAKFGAGFGFGIYIPPFPINVNFSYPLSPTEHKNWKITLFLGESF